MILEVRTDTVETPSTTVDYNSFVEKTIEPKEEVTQEISSEVKAKEEAPKADDSPMSRRLADLARKEKARVEKELKFKEEMSAWEQTKSKYDPVLQAVSNFKDNPNDVEAALKLLEVTGISYQELTDRILQGEGFSSEPTEPKEEAKPSKSVEEAVEELLAKKEAEKKQKEIDEFFVAFKESIAAEAAKDTYKFIKQDPSYIDTIFELCVNYYDKYRQELPIESAAAEVEKHLKEEYRKEYLKYQQLLGDEKIESPAVEQNTSFTSDYQLPVINEPKVMRTIGNKEGNYKTEEIKKTTELSKEEALQLLIKQLG